MHHVRFHCMLLGLTRWADSLPCNISSCVMIARLHVVKRGRVLHAPNCSCSLLFFFFWVRSRCQFLENENANNSQVQELICIVVRSSVCILCVVLSIWTVLFYAHLWGLQFVKPHSLKHRWNWWFLWRWTKKERELCGAFRGGVVCLTWSWSAPFSYIFFI